MKITKPFKIALGATIAVIAISAMIGSATEEVATEAETVTVSADTDGGIGDGAEPLPVIDEPVIDEPVIEEPVIEEPVIEEPVIEEPVIEDTEPVEPVTPPEPEEPETPAQRMRLYAPPVLAAEGHALSDAGLVAWVFVDDETFDSVGAALCDSINELGVDLTAALLGDDAASMLEAFGVAPSIESGGAAIGVFIGAYCPDAL